MIDWERGTFASFDGTPIAYARVGQRALPPMLLLNGIGGTDLVWRFIVERFSSSFQFFTYDYRGLHRSARPVGGYRALGVDAHAKDAAALAHHLGHARYHLFGWSMGVQVALELQRDHGPDTESLVLHNGVAGHPFRSLYGVPWLERVLPAILRRLQAHDRALTQLVKRLVHLPPFIPLVIALGLAHQDIDREVFGGVAKSFEHLDMHLYLEMLLRLGEHDASDVLGTITAPALVLASSHDVMTPLDAASALAAGIPGAAREVLKSGTHYAAVELPTEVNLHLADFFGRHGWLRA